MTFHQSQSFESSKPNLWLCEGQNSSTPLPAAFLGQWGSGGGQAPCHGPARCSQSCWKLHTWWHFVSLDPYLFKVATLLLVALGLCPKSLWNFSEVEGRTGPERMIKHDFFWHHIGPLGRTVWGLDRIPLKDLKVGEEVDGRVKGRYRSMGWFLVRRVSLEGGHSWFSRSHFLLSCASVPSWNDRLGHTGPRKCWSLGRKGYIYQVCIYTYIIWSFHRVLI